MTIQPKWLTQSRHNKSTRPTPKERKRAYELARERSKGVCEHCFAAPVGSVHHRLYQSRGGEDEVTNLICLCGRGNTDLCHGLAHTKNGERIGLSVPSGMVPAQVSMRDVYGRTWLFGADGTKEATV